MNNKELFTIDDYQKEIKKEQEKLDALEADFQTINKKSNKINIFLVTIVAIAFLTHLLGGIIGNPFVILAALSSLLVVVAPLGFYNINLDDKVKKMEKEIENTKNKIDEYANEIENQYDRNNTVSNRNTKADELITTIEKKTPLKIDYYQPIRKENIVNQTKTR